MARPLRIEYPGPSIMSSIKATPVKLICNKVRRFLEQNKQLRIKLEEIKKHILNIWDVTPLHTNVMNGVRIN